MRVIPTMLVKGRKLVKGRQFSGDRIVGVAEQAARIHARRGVDELCILDIAATAEGRGPDLSLIEQLSQEIFTPLSVGGGVKSVDDVAALLRAGADKVVIGSGGPLLVSKCAQRFGSQAIIAAVDVRGGLAHVHCGTTETRQPALLWAQSCSDHGAGELLLQSIDRDGTMQGYDLDLIRQVSAAVDIPVIASGGCSGPADMLAAIEAGASACAAGSLFQFTDTTPADCARYLAEQGKEVRV